MPTRPQQRRKPELSRLWPWSTARSTQLMTVTGPFCRCVSLPPVGGPDEDAAGIEAGAIGGRGLPLNAELARPTIWFAGPRVHETRWLPACQPKKHEANSSIERCQHGKHYHVVARCHDRDEQRCTHGRGQHATQNSHGHPTFRGHDAVRWPSAHGAAVRDSVHCTNLHGWSDAG